MTKGLDDELELIETTIGVDLGNDNVDGGLALNPEKKYYFYDFWNDHLLGVFKGDGRLEQTLRPGEARMLSVHQVESNPQFISTNRHIMQGYVDMARYPVWDADKKVLSGISKVVSGETYKVVIALNGFLPDKAKAKAKAIVGIEIVDEKNGLAILSLDSDENMDIAWSVSFK